MSISEALVADFDLEAKNSRRMLEAVPDDGLDFKPHEKSWTLGQLASHIAETPSWLGAMQQDSFDMADAGGGDYQPYVATSKEDLLATFDKNAASVGEILGGRDDDFMNATWTMTAGDKVLMKAPRHAAVRSILIHHVIHHRGQLSVYLRLAGAQVPPTYGPTADDASGF